MWVVVKIMVPFWVPVIVRHLILRVPKKRDHNFDNHPCECTYVLSLFVYQLLVFLGNRILAVSISIKARPGFQVILMILPCMHPRRMEILQGLDGCALILSLLKDFRLSDPNDWILLRCGAQSICRQNR